MRDYGVRTTVLFAPFEQAYIQGSGYTEADILAALRKDGVDVLVDRLPKIADEDLYWIQGDGHPTALSNKTRAAEIEAHLRDVDPAALAVASTVPATAASAPLGDAPRLDRRAVLPEPATHCRD